MDMKPKPVPGVPLAVPAPPSIPNLRILFVRAIELGRVRMSQHFRDQARLRGFSTLDAEQILEEGEFVSGPKFEREYCSWKMEIFLRLGGKGWKLVVALDYTADYCESPLINLITVHQIGIKHAKPTRG